MDSKKRVAPFIFFTALLSLVLLTHISFAQEAGPQAPPAAEQAARLPLNSPRGFSTNSAAPRSRWIRCGRSSPACWFSS
jgi:hypothetical protein